MIFVPHQKSVTKMLSNSFAFASMMTSSLFFAACSSASKMPEQALTRHVDLSKFMGRWYVISSIPTMFETGAVNATETYTWNQKEERVDIDFRYRQDSPEGKEKTIPQKGFIDDHETNAKWKIEPFWPLKFGYLIVYLNEDYSATAIGVPNRGHVWIMARKPDLPEKEYTQILERLKYLGYDLSKLIKVPQVWSDKK